MKKLFILIGIVLLFLSVSTVNAVLFWPDTIECEQFSIEIPSGFSETEGWADHLEKPQDYVYVGTGIPNKGETHRMLEVCELTSNNNARINGTIVVENYTADNLLLQKCQVPEYNKDKNYTYVEFDKDGHHYAITITWDNNIEKLNLSDDVELVKKVIDSTKHK